MKVDKLIKIYDIKLQFYLKTYFEAIGKDEKQNQLIFKTIDLHWKKLCVKVNATQKKALINKGSFKESVDKVYAHIKLSKWAKFKLWFTKLIKKYKWK